MITKKIPYTYKSPLRYPGGKSRAAETIASFFPEITALVSPFFGGGSLELYLSAKGIRVLGFDIFAPLVEFWQCLLTDPEKLASAVRKYYPLSKEDFYCLQKNQMNFKLKLERAAVYYVINRSSFSGSTLSGGMSPLHPRFTLSAIERVRNFNNPLINIKQAHFSESLSRYKNVFAYLDPPYFIENSLYGRNGDAHRNFAHQELAALLRSREKWILSYNDCTRIRNLYKGFRITTPEWKYGMSVNKDSNEVLIFSKDLS